MTRIELIFSAYALTMIAALAAPAILITRERQHQATCQNSLRQIGVSLFTFADRDTSNRLCSGLPDWLYDGCPDTYGWPADLRQTVGDRGVSLMCPSNPAGVPDTFEDLVGKAGSVAISQRSPVSDDFVNVGRCRDFAVSFEEPHNNPDSGGEFGGLQSRKTAVKDFFSSSFATNYAASWYLARTRFRTIDEFASPKAASEELNARHLAATVGPIQIRTLDRSHLPSSLVPLLGDAAPSTRATPELLSIGLVTSKTPPAVSLSGVPSYYTTVGDNLLQLQPKEIAQPGQEAQPRRENRQPLQFIDDLPPTPEKPRGSGGLDGKLWLSDLRGWKTVHAINGGTLSVLMADGSIKSLIDINGDGFINPGFDILGPRLNHESGSIESSKTGYIDGTTEVFAGSMYTGGDVSDEFVCDRFTAW